MNGNFKTCPKGHYYSASLAQCPYCTGSNACANDGSTRTIGNAGGFASSETEKTRDLSGGAWNPQMQGDPNATRTMGQNAPEPAPAPKQTERTMIFDENENVGFGAAAAMRTRRKLVGWLVSFTLDPMGVDFQLYEGRNIIGRSEDCQAVINDRTVSGEHAIILFRAGKFSIRDNQSTQGTYVNNEDIELDTRYLNDGDIIRLGKTTLLFRTAF